MAIVYLSKSPRQMDNIVRSLPDKCTSPRPALPVVSSYVFSFTYFVGSLLYSVFIFSSRCETNEVGVADSGLTTRLLLCKHLAPYLGGTYVLFAFLSSI